MPAEARDHARWGHDKAQSLGYRSARVRAQTGIVEGRWGRCEALDCTVLFPLFEDAVPQELFAQTRYTRIALARRRNHEDVEPATGVEVKVKCAKWQKS